MNAGPTIAGAGVFLFANSAISKITVIGVGPGRARSVASALAVDGDTKHQHGVVEH